jgi:hypothetical protein
MTLSCHFCLNLRASIERNVEMSIAIATAVIDAKRLRQVYALKRNPHPGAAVRSSLWEISVGQIIAGKWSASAAKKPVDQR